MDATRGILVAVARADLMLCRARASPWPWAILAGLLACGLARLVFTMNRKRGRTR